MLKSCICTISAGALLSPQPSALTRDAGGSARRSSWNMTLSALIPWQGK